MSYYIRGVLLSNRWEQRSRRDRYPWSGNVVLAFSLQPLVVSRACGAISIYEETISLAFDYFLFSWSPPLRFPMWSAFLLGVYRREIRTGLPGGRADRSSSACEEAPISFWGDILQARVFEGPKDLECHSLALELYFACPLYSSCLVKGVALAPGLEID